METSSLGLHATRPVRPGVGSELGERGLELQAAGRSPAGHRSRGCPGDSAASAASAPPPASHWAVPAPRDHRHLTFLKCVYYAGSDPSGCPSAQCFGKVAIAGRLRPEFSRGSRARSLCGSPQPQATRGCYRPRGEGGGVVLLLVLGAASIG